MGWKTSGIMTQYWFKPKSHGYGANPATWQGYAVTLAFLAAILAVSLVLIAWPSQAGAGLSVWRLGVWGLAMFGLCAAFLRLCKARTDGEWRWRWKGN